MDQYADGSGSIDFTPYQQAIKNIESSGGDYNALGPVTSSGDRAYGAYQVMGSNVPDWTEKHFGQRLTPDQFLKNKAAQDAVFNGEFGAALQKHGNPQDAAAVWFSGRPLSQSANNSDGYITTRQYVDKFNKNLGQPASPGALAFSGDDDAEDAAPGALSPRPGALSPDGVKDVMKGDKPNKLAAIGAMLTSMAAGLSSGVNPSQANALLAQLKAQNDATQAKYKYMMGADGTLYRMDDSGGIQAIKTGSTKHTLQLKEATVNGQKVSGNYDPQNGSFTPLGGTGAPQPAINSIDDLRAIDPHRADAAQAVADGRAPFPNTSRLNERQQQLRDDVIAAFPGVDANVFAARKKFQENKASQNPTTYGGLIARGDIAADQLNDTLDAYGRLGNTSSMLGANAAAAENYLSSGGVENARTRDMLETSAGNAASDINAIQNGGRGGQAERETIKNGLNLPYASHVEQSGAVQAHINALRAGIQARFDQEKTQLGEDYLRNDPDYVRLNKKLDGLQEKADKLYKGDFSYARGAKPAAAAPTINHDAIDAELKRRGLM